MPTPNWNSKLNRYSKNWQIKDWTQTKRLFWLEEKLRFKSNEMSKLWTEFRCVFLVCFWSHFMEILRCCSKFCNNFPNWIRHSKQSSVVWLFFSSHSCFVWTPGCSHCALKSDSSVAPVFTLNACYDSCRCTTMTNIEHQTDDAVHKNLILFNQKMNQTDLGHMRREKSDYGQLGLLCKCRLTSNRSDKNNCKKTKQKQKCEEVWA